MKKFLKSAAILMFGFGVAATFTACHSGSSESTPETPTEQIVEEDALEDDATVTTKTVIIRTIPGATVTYGTQVVVADENGIATLNAPKDATSIVVNIAKNGYTTQNNVTIDLDANGIAKSSVTLRPTADNSATKQETTAVETTNNEGQTVAQGGEDGQGVVVTNDETNQNDNATAAGEQAEASFTIPTGTVIDKSDVADQNQAYSITVVDTETEAQVGSEDVDALTAKKNENVQANPLALSCTPDGIKFATPITIKVKVPGAAGYELDLVDESGVSAQNVKTDPVTGELTAEVSHFSVWDIVLKARLVSSVEVAEEVVGSGTVSANRATTLRYGRIYGFSSTEDSKSITSKFLKSYFGSTKTSLTKTGRYTAAFDGAYTVIQKRYTVTFQSTISNATFQATVWGTPQIKVTPNAQPVTPTHSGGSN